MERWLLVLGGSSDIAIALASRFAKEGFHVYMAGRNVSLLTKLAKDFSIRYGIKAVPLKFDALDFNSHKRFYTDLRIKPVGVLCAVGYIGDQKKAEKDFMEWKKIIDINYTGCVSILNIIASDMEKRKEGFIIGISSVAGDRGRATNYFYGSAKAAFTTYLAGLRNRMIANKRNVQVITVKPGFVNTKMTEDMDLPELLTAEPEEVARDIYNAYKKGKNIVYTKWFWKYIMMVIKVLPDKFLRF